jgi:hypothetical protein
LRETKEDDANISIMGCFGTIAIILFVVYAVWPRSNQRSNTSDVSSCVEQGVAYFKEIGSYPYLSTGRDARSVAVERCSRTSGAFDH